MIAKSRKQNQKKIKHKVGCVKCHFLDSGAFSLKTRAITYHNENGGDPWGFYDTDEFWQYMDAYAVFVKKYAVGIDYYANVDVIPNPQLSWRNLKYLEKQHGLSPVPVIHLGTHTRWLKRHMNKYSYIGLGGLVGNTMRRPKIVYEWLNRCFNIVCDTSDRLPLVKMHGFGITNVRLLLMYPWYSVDSTSWTKAGGFGFIFVPKKKQGRFCLHTRPTILSVSLESPSVKIKGDHLYTITKQEKRDVLEWLEIIDIELGKDSDDVGNGWEDGVVTNNALRRLANLRYFERLRHALPEYPQPFPEAHVGGFI